MNKVENVTLKVPENTSDRNDYVQGIGKKELAAIVCSLGIAIAVLIFALIAGANMVIWMFVVVFGIAFTVVAVRRDNTNESMIDKIRFMIQYQKSQKRYIYKKYNFLQPEQPGKGEENDGK